MKKSVLFLLDILFENMLAPIILPIIFFINLFGVKNTLLDGFNIDQAFQGHCKYQMMPKEKEPPRFLVIPQPI